MKIAVISDIHGNMEALNAVMNDINSQNCDEIFALGDYAMAGPEPDKVVDYFMGKVLQNNFQLIQGNTDYFIANFSENLYVNLKEKAPVMAEALRNDVSILNKTQIDFLKKLPSQLNLERDGVKILLVHGSPRKNNEDILPITPLEKLEDIIAGVEADVVLCGHTHLPCGFQTDSKKTIVNVGSVGRPFTDDPKACYLKMTIIEGQCLFEHRFVDYDRKLASEKLLKRGFQGCEKLANTLLNPSERHF